jgi:crossover junction endodeoxyribonuclease RuvC
MRILAIDPGYGRCGVAIIEGSPTAANLLYSNCIETAANTDFSDRLQAVGDEIVRLIKEYRPEKVALEELFFSGNQKTALNVAEVRGMLLYIAASNSLPVTQFNPGAIKIATTGYGRATKTQVIKMTEKLVRLPKKEMLDDEHDAIALGITALANEKTGSLRSNG